MCASCCNFKSTLGLHLPAHLAQIKRMAWLYRRQGLHLLPKSKLFVSVTLTRNSEEIGRWPSDAPLMLSYEGPDLEANDWLI